MSRDKQIEEMAKTIADCGICIYHGDVCTREEEVSDDLALCIARVLNEQGYRKASDVAEEIFAEIDSCIFPYSTHGIFSSTKYAELKKKYTEEGK